MSSKYPDNIDAEVAAYNAERAMLGLPPAAATTPTHITADSFDSSLTPAISSASLQLPHGEFRALIQQRIRNAQKAAGFPIKTALDEEHDAFYDICDINTVNYTPKPMITVEEARELDQADIAAGRPLPTVPRARHDMTREIIDGKIQFARDEGMKPAPEGYPVRAQRFMRPSIGIGFVEMSDEEWCDYQDYTQEQRNEVAEQKKRPCTQDDLQKLLSEEKSTLQSIANWKKQTQH